MSLNVKNNGNIKNIETDITSISFAGADEFNKLKKDLDFNYLAFFAGNIPPKVYKDKNLKAVEEWTNISVSVIKGDSIEFNMCDSMRRFADELSQHENVKNIYFHSENNELWIVLENDDYASVKEVCSMFFEYCEDHEFSFITCTEEQLVVSEAPECLKKYR